MPASYDRTEPCTRVFTTHGTVMFVDSVSGELRHGPLTWAASNVTLVREADKARLIFLEMNNTHEILCLPEFSAVVGSRKLQESKTVLGGGNSLRYVSAVGGEFGLADDDRFLCAEPDGRITLSRARLGAWEQFRLRTEASGSLVEQIRWSPVHGGTLRVGDDGTLILGDENRLDWHLLRWTDPRLNGTRVKLTVVAKATSACDTNLYVHHWGNIDVCSIDKDGNTVLNEGGAHTSVERQPDGFLLATIIFDNRHPTLSFGTGKPRGRYQGRGADQYILRSIGVELLPLNPVRQHLVNRLWKGRDPICGLPHNLYDYDLQGWNSQHSYLGDAIAALRPDVIVEIGVWKGGSTVFMANELKKHGLASVVVAVDTWLGASDHWTGPFMEDLSFLNGYPAVYYKFLSNVIRSGVADFVLPLPMDSLNAAAVLKSQNIRPAMIHLDAGHDYDSVMADLRVWWPLLTPGGILVGDDYYTSGVWPGVRQAFDNFFSALNLIPIEHEVGKCRVYKKV